MNMIAMARARARALVPPENRRRIGVLGLFVLLGAIAFGGARAGAADGAQVCGERDVLLAQLALQHKETPQALGLGADGGVIEVLVSPEGGWTMLVTYPARPTCVIATGEAWETVELAGDPT